MGHPRSLLLALMAILLVPACSSTMDVFVIRQELHLALQPQQSECDVVLHPQEDEYPETCTEVADVYVGDTGSSTNCGYERVYGEVRTAACEVGANAVQVIRHHRPSFFGSTCHQLRARLLRCETPEE